MAVEKPSYGVERAFKVMSGAKKVSYVSDPFSCSAYYRMVEDGMRHQFAVRSTKIIGGCGVLPSISDSLEVVTSVATNPKAAGIATALNIAHGSYKKKDFDKLIKEAADSQLIARAMLQNDEQKIHNLLADMTALNSTRSENTIAPSSEKNYEYTLIIENSPVTENVKTPTLTIQRGFNHGNVKATAGRLEDMDFLEKALWTQANVFSEYLKKQL